MMCVPHKCWLIAVGYDQSDQEETQEGPQPSEAATEMVADGSENDVGGVSGVSFE